MAVSAGDELRIRDGHNIKAMTVICRNHYESIFVLANLLKVLDSSANRVVQLKQFT
jgi:hypothetical protein